MSTLECSGQILRSLGLDQIGENPRISLLRVVGAHLSLRSLIMDNTVLAHPAYKGAVG